MWRWSQSINGKHEVLVYSTRWIWMPSVPKQNALVKRQMPEAIKVAYRIALRIVNNNIHYDECSAIPTTSSSRWSTRTRSIYAGLRAKTTLAHLKLTSTPSFESVLPGTSTSYFSFSFVASSLETDKRPQDPVPGPSERPSVLCTYIRLMWLQAEKRSARQLARYQSKF